MATAIEFYAGIGGFAAAIRPGLLASSLLDLELPEMGPLEITSAWDIDVAAIEAYRLNFPSSHGASSHGASHAASHAARAGEIRSLEIARLKADLWWMSPPCLPFTRKGKQRDLDDPRSDSMVSLIGKVHSRLDYPRWIVIENVPPFADSRAGAWVREHLEGAGFQCEWEIRCPTELGWPVRRLRSYLIASRDGLLPLAMLEPKPTPLSVFVDPGNDDDPNLAVPQEWFERYSKAIDLVDPQDPAAQGACFTSSYGRMPVRSGSYISPVRGDRNRARFFSPREVLATLGFGADYRLPEQLSTRRQWSLVGNSLALAVVRWVLGRLPIASASASTES